MSWHSELQAQEHQAVLNSGSRRQLRAREHDLRVWLRNPQLRPEGWSEEQTRRELAEVEHKLSEHERR